MSSVFVVVHDNYGDQGVDFHGVFSTHEKANAYIHRREPLEGERQWWSIEESVIDKP